MFELFYPICLSCDAPVVITQNVNLNQSTFVLTIICKFAITNNYIIPKARESLLSSCLWLLFLITDHDTGHCWAREGAADVLHKAEALHSDEAHHAQRLLICWCWAEARESRPRHIIMMLTGRMDDGQSHWKSKNLKIHFQKKKIITPRLHGFLLHHHHHSSHFYVS